MNKADLIDYLERAIQRAKAAYSYDEDNGLMTETHGRETEIEDYFYDILIEDDILYDLSK